MSPLTSLCISLLHFSYISLHKDAYGVSSLHIQEFQKMMLRIFLHRDFKRGTTGTYDWLMDEVKELGEALKAKDEQALKMEFADVFAWLASLANLSNIDLEKVALTKYNNKCPKCGTSSCQCTS